MQSHKFVSNTMGNRCFCEYCGLSLTMVPLASKTIEAWTVPECKLSPKQLDATQVPNQSVDGSNPSWEDTKQNEKRMTELICKKHNKKLECRGGCSAHRDNWYCPECEENKTPEILWPASRQYRNSKGDPIPAFEYSETVKIVRALEDENAELRKQGREACRVRNTEVEELKAELEQYRTAHAVLNDERVKDLEDTIKMYESYK